MPYLCSMEVDMLVIIEKFNKNDAVCEMEDGTMIDVPKPILPCEAQDGDVLKISVKINKLKTQKCKNEMEKILNELLCSE